MANYRGPHFGYFDKAINRVGLIYDVYIRTDIIPESDGTLREVYAKTKVFGNLQDYHKKQTYSLDGANSSSIDGRFYAKYEVNLYEGDMIKKNNSLFRVTDMDDYDFQGVKVYNVIRLGMEESRKLMTRFEVEASQIKIFDE